MSDVEKTDALSHGNRVKLALLINELQVEMVFLTEIKSFFEVREMFPFALVIPIEYVICRIAQPHSIQQVIKAAY